MNSIPTRLGRGLSSLLGDEFLEEKDTAKIQVVEVSRIEPSPNQPRKNIQDDALMELSESILEQGILQPIIVRPKGVDRFEIIAGERRWRAAKLKNIEKIPVIVKDVDDTTALELTILENVQREDLNPIELARAYERLVHDFGYSHKKIGRKIGVSRMAVSNTIRILQLPETILQKIENGHMTMGHARALLPFIDEAEFISGVAEKISEEALSVRDVEEIIGTRRENPEEGADEKKYVRKKSPEICSIENKLNDRLQTKISITQTKGKGKIILQYDGQEEFDVLVGKLLSL